MKSKVAEISKLLAKELQRGEHGGVGEPFMTIRDICDNFNVSLQTAQRIVDLLKKDSLLSRSGRNLVIGRGIRTGKKDRGRRIGVMVNNMDNPFTSRLLNALETAGRRCNADIIAAGSDFNLTKEKKNIELLKKCGVEAFIICPAGSGSRTALNALNLPFVLIGHEVSGVNADVCGVNDLSCGFLAARHLADSKCASYLYAGPEFGSKDARFEGYLQGLRENGIDFDTVNRIFCRTESNMEQLCSFMKNRCRGKKRIGIFCYHDLIALRIMRAAHICGLRVPEDIAVVGVDDLPIAREVFPSLTTLRYPVQQIAFSALQLLLAEDDTEREKVPRLFEPVLIRRESSWTV